MQDEFLVVSVTHTGLESWPALLCEFPGGLDVQISERWIQTVTEFQLEVPYLSDRASYQLSGRPWRGSVRCVVFD